MAVVGDAYVVVRALTNRVRPEIQKAFSGLDDIGRRAGEDISNALTESVTNNMYVSTLDLQLELFSNYIYPSSKITI
jgi:hypothetical protein